MELRLATVALIHAPNGWGWTKVPKKLRQPVGGCGTVTAIGGTAAMSRRCRFNREAS